MNTELNQIVETQLAFILQVTENSIASIGYNDIEVKVTTIDGEIHHFYNSNSEANRLVFNTIIDNCFDVDSTPSEPTIVDEFVDAATEKAIKTVNKVATKAADFFTNIKSKTE